MQGWNLSDCGARLQPLLETLKQKRVQAAMLWNDATQERFEAKYLVPLDAQTKRASEAILRLAAVIAQAERQCGD